MFNKKKPKMPKEFSQSDFEYEGESYETEDSFEPAFEEPPKKSKKAKKAKQKKEKIRGESINVSFWKSRPFLGIVCVVIALIITFVAVPAMEGLTSNKVFVVQTKQHITKGTFITADMVKSVEIGGYNISETTLTSVNDAIGKYAAIDMVSGDTVTTDKVSSVIPFENAYLYELEDGKLAMSVTIQSLAKGLTGKLRAGDICSIYAIYREDVTLSKIYDATLRPELQYVEVIAVSDEAGNDITDETMQAAIANAEENDTAEQFMPVTVTFKVNNQQASVLAGIEENAALHIALVARYNATDRQSYLDAQDEFLKKLLEEEMENTSSVAEETTSSGATSSDGTSSEATSSEGTASEGTTSETTSSAGTASKTN